MGISKQKVIQRQGKRKTPPEDYERFAKNIWGIYGDDIVDIDSYNDAFDEYMGENLQPAWDKELRREGFNAVARLHPSVVEEHWGDVNAEDYKEGERPDKRKLRKVERFDGKERKFVYIGQVYNKKLGIRKDVYAREDKVKYKIKGEVTERTVYRDRKGRFVRKSKE